MGKKRVGRPLMTWFCFVSKKTDLRNLAVLVDVTLNINRNGLVVIGEYS